MKKSGSPPALSLFLFLSLSLARSLCFFVFVYVRLCICFSALLCACLYMQRRALLYCVYKVCLWLIVDTKTFLSECSNSIVWNKDENARGVTTHTHRHTHAHTCTHAHACTHSFVADVYLCTTCETIFSLSMCACIFVYVHVYSAESALCMCIYAHTTHGRLPTRMNPSIWGHSSVIQFDTWCAYVYCIEKECE